MIDQNIATSCVAVVMTLTIPTSVHATSCNDDLYQVSNKITAPSQRPPERSSFSEFGTSVAAIGDLDDDGVIDLAVGAPLGMEVAGNIWILFMNPDGTLRNSKKINLSTSPCTSTDSLKAFGTSIAALGDINGDGVEDIAVGAPQSDVTLPTVPSAICTDCGTVLLLCLSPGGDVVDCHRLSEPGLTALPPSELTERRFGQSVTSLGDLNGSGTVDLAVGTTRDDDGGINQGAVWILFLDGGLSIDSSQKISATSGGFPAGGLDPEDQFGMSLATLPFIEKDAVVTLAVGAIRDDDAQQEPGLNRGAVWILGLNEQGTVVDSSKISDTAGGFTGMLDDEDGFGFSIASLGDINGDGLIELAVGADGDDGDKAGAQNQGALWILSLNADATVSSFAKVADFFDPDFMGLDEDDRFGRSVMLLNSATPKTSARFAVGAHRDDDGGKDSGAVWLFIRSCCGDLTMDGFVGPDDLATLLGAWGANPGNPADLDKDGVVNAADLAILLGGWGGC